MNATLLGLHFAVSATMICIIVAGACGLSAAAVYWWIDEVLRTRRWGPEDDVLFQRELLVYQRARD